ncbi:MAG: amine dehydrogenase large subunit [Myxococcota bacterium]
MKRALVTALAALFLAAGSARAEFVPEVVGQVATLPAPGPHWVWVGDLLLRRAALVDTDTGTFLGMLSSSVGPIVPLVSPVGGPIYLPETYYSRGSRGARTDVVTVYDPATLAPRGEVVIPPKRADVVHGAGLSTLLDDGRFAAVFNLTPATSVSVVDTAELRFAGEIETPGCSLVYAAGKRRVAMLCADGSLLLLTLDERGAEANRFRSAVFFDPEQDPLIEKPARGGSSWYFVSFEGFVHEVDLSGEVPRFGQPWSLFTAEERAENWRFGGAQPLALHEASGRLYALVHQGGKDGHKEPGSAVAVFDTAKRERVQTIAIGNLVAAFLASRMQLGEGSWGAWILDAIVPNAGADRIAVTQDAAPRLILVSEEGGTVGVHDALSGAHLRNISDVGFFPGVVSAPWR